MSDPNDWNRQVIEEFRANDGRVGGPFENMPIVLVHHKGAKSGVERINPLAYQPSGDSYAIFASFAGAPKDPDWYHNLVANPDTTIEVGSRTVAVRARTAEGEERQRIWEAQKAASPGFAEYEEKAAPRVIPVVVLDPVDQPAA